MRRVLYNMTCYKLTISNNLQSLFSRCLSFPCISKIRNEWKYKRINIDTVQIRIGVRFDILDNINLYALSVNNLLLRLDFFRTLVRISRLIKRKTICCTLLLTSTVHLTINYPNHYIFLFSTPVYTESDVLFSLLNVI